MKKPNKFKEQYSGDKSKRFWKVINSLDKETHGEMYFAGVLLQNMEGDVIRMLNQYIGDGHCSKERLESFKKAASDYYEKHFSSSTSTDFEVDPEEFFKDGKENTTFADITAEQNKRYNKEN